MQRLPMALVGRTRRCARWLATFLFIVAWLGCGKPENQTAAARSPVAPSVSATASDPPSTALPTSAVAPSPSAVASAVENGEPAREQVVLRMTRNELHLEGKRVASTSNSGFARSARGGHHQAGLPSLPDAIVAARPRRVHLVADGDVDYLHLVEALSDVRRAGVKQWALQVDGMERGQFTFATEDPELTVNDLYMGKPTPARKSAIQLQREGPGKARRVEFVLDFGSTVADVAPSLQAASGLELELGFHTGPY